MTTRRAFVQGVGAVGLALVGGCGLPVSAPPQAATVHRIAYLRATPPDAVNEALVSAFLQGMRDLGYVDAQVLVIEQRHADGVDRLAEPAAELVRLQPEVILVPGVPAARVALAATTTIPIVCAGSSGGLDLVASGLAASLAHPGGNVTGLSTPLSLAGKQLQLLQEVVPTLARVAVLVDSTVGDILREPYEAAVRSLGLQLQFVGANVREEVETVFEAAIRQHADGLFVTTGPVISANQTRIAELAVQSRLPTMWAQSDAVGRGGLMAYGPNRAALYRRAAYYVDRILKGAKPADLPIEEPREFDFVVNLQTAQALGLTIPQSVLLQATEVIQ